MRVIKGDALKALKDWVNLLSKVSFVNIKKLHTVEVLLCLCALDLFLL